MQLQGKERRRYYRIDDDLVVDYKVLQHEEYEQERILLKKQPSGLRNLKNKYTDFLPNGLDLENLGAKESELFRGLLKLIININEKVDIILSLLDKKGEVNICHKPPQRVNLSAEGLGFCTTEPLVVGSYLKIRMVLPQSPQVLITTLAKVVRVAPKEGKENDFDVGINFLDIHQDDQDLIIKYIFTRQRDILRSLNKQDA